jgi:hypothetical protein
MQANMIPVRYIGNSRTWTDDLYGSNVVFKKNQVSQTPDWAAKSLLRHTEFADARPIEQRGKPIIADKPDVLTEHEREIDELDSLEQHAQIHTMTKAQLAVYAQRAFGVKLDVTDLKVDVVHTVRNLIRARGRVN